MTKFGATDPKLKILNASQPFLDAEPSMKWDGEWHITIEVFRDLGIAFGAVLVLIYILMVGWFKSFITPLIVMVAIPFSLIGVLPAHGMMGAFFSATSMIGFMAGGGIVVRNSIILVDFIQLRLREGMPLREAVVDAGAVRFRPMLLTALAVVVGASVIRERGQSTKLERFRFDLVEVKGHRRDWLRERARVADPYSKWGIGDDSCIAQWLLVSHDVTDADLEPLPQHWGILRADASASTCTSLRAAAGPGLVTDPGRIERSLYAAGTRAVTGTLPTLAGCRSLAAVTHRLAQAAP
jgi:hypothetical protein